MLNLHDVMSPKTRAILNSMAIKTAATRRQEAEEALAWISRDHSEAKLEDRIRTQTKQYNEQFVKQGVR